VCGCIIHPHAPGLPVSLAIMDWATRKVLAWRLSNTGSVLEAFAPTENRNEERLSQSQDSVLQLEELGCVMLDRVVPSGVAREDLELVELAKRGAREITELTEAALRDRALSETDLFDEAYTEVPGTIPQQFRTRLSDWADRNWRPVLDRIKASDPRVFLTVCDDRHRHVTTHLTEFSRPQTGDLDQDTQRALRDGGVPPPEGRRSLHHRPDHQRPADLRGPPVGRIRAVI